MTQQDKKFPKYVRIKSTEMVRLGSLKDNQATYFRPCGEWSGDLKYKDGQYYMPIIDHKHTCKSVSIEEISAKDFLKANPYGYSNTTKKVFEIAMKDCGMEDNVIIKHDRHGIYYTHRFS